MIATISAIEELNNGDNANEKDNENDDDNELLRSKQGFSYRFSPLNEYRPIPTSE